MSKPLLYTSLFLKNHRSQYYERLDAVRSDGDWEGWLAFFLEGVAVVADEAVNTARILHKVVRDCRDRLLALEPATLLSLRLFELLPQNPILSVNKTIDLLQCSRPAAIKALIVLESAGIMRSLDDRKKNRSLLFHEYLQHLRQDAENPY